MKNRFWAIALGLTVSVNASAALVASYEFNGNANDLSGNGLNGIVNGATLAIDRFGNLNSAYSFDGNDNIRVLDDSNLDLNNTFTISTWINPQGGYGNESDGHIDIVSKWGAGGVNNAAYLLGINSSGNILMGAYDGVLGGVYTNNTQVIPTNDWTHVLVTQSNDIANVFINGVLSQSFSNTIVPQNSSYDLFIGQEPVGGNNFIGSIDDIGIYNHALSNAEIQVLADISQVPAPTAIWLLSTGLIGLFGMRKKTEKYA